jgi:hypothetical protein
VRILGSAITAAGLVASCVGRGGAPPAAPVDVTVADVGDASASVAIAPPKARPANARCTAHLTAGNLEKAATCRVDTKVVDGPGKLAWPCSGDGPAEATFGDQRFAGTVRGGYLRLEIKTNPDWGDGCGWESRQLIEGYVRDRQLAWRYDETLLDASHGSCYAPCDAKTALDVEPDE